MPLLTRNTVIITTAAQRDNSNLVFAAWGRGPNNFVLPLSATGNDPATHYGCFDASMLEDESMHALAMPDNNGTVPHTPEDGWLAYIDAENEAAALAAARAACAVMTVSVATNIDSTAHRNSVLSGLSLQVIEPDI